MNARAMQLREEDILRALYTPRVENPTKGKLLLLKIFQDVIPDGRTDTFPD